MKRLAAMHLVGNALILLLGYYWLGLPESSAALTLWSALVLLVTSAAALFLHGTASVYFRRRGKLGKAARIAALHLPALFALLILTVVIYASLAYLDEHFSHQAFTIGSYATMKTRKAVAPAAILYVWHFAIAAFQWMLVPALLLPVAASVAERGWQGFAPRIWKRQRASLYVLVVVILLVIAIYVPLHILKWVPSINSFAGQFASFTARFAIAYLLFVFGLLAAEYISARRG